MVKLIHGILAREGGRASMGALKKALSRMGIESEIVHYGFIFIPVTNAWAVRAVLKALEDDPQPTIVAYSNAGWASVQAAELGANIQHLIVVSPALHTGHEFPGNIETIDVFYSPDDDVVLGGRLWRWITSILPWRWANPHGWGTMGRSGYLGEDPRVRNHRLPSGVGHFWFTDAQAVEQVAQCVSYYEDTETVSASNEAAIT